MYSAAILLFFLFNHTATTVIYTLSLHDALPISFIAKTVSAPLWFTVNSSNFCTGASAESLVTNDSDSSRSRLRDFLDRKSTRLNSSHSSISYAVFCLKKKRLHQTNRRATHFAAR